MLICWGFLSETRAARMIDYSEQIKVAIEATVFYSSTTYSCFGKQPVKIPPRIQRGMTPRTARNHVLTQLQSNLYSDFYVSGARTANAFGDSGGLTGSARFVESLSAANAGVGHWENGWQVLETMPGDVLVRKNALTLCVPPNCLSPADQCLAAGTTVRLRLPKEWLRISPGYYLALSNQADDAGEGHPLVRLYWNIQAEGAEILVRTATRWLNEAHLFFKLKLLNNPAAYTRCDAGVLYFRKHEYSAIADVVARIYPRIACYLRTGCRFLQSAWRPELL